MDIQRLVSQILTGLLAGSYVFLASATVLRILLRSFASSERNRWYWDISKLYAALKVVYWLLSVAFRAVRDCAPGLIISYITGLGSSKLLAVSGLKYFHRSRGTNPSIINIHLWNCSGFSKTTLLAVSAVVEAIVE